MWRVQILTACPADALSVPIVWQSGYCWSPPGLRIRFTINNNALLYKYDLFLSTTIYFYFLLYLIHFYSMMMMITLRVKDRQRDISISNSCKNAYRVSCDTVQATPAHLTRIMHVRRRRQFTRARLGFRNLVNHCRVTRYENGTEMHNLRSKYLEIV